MMQNRIAVLSDVHGNLPALEAVLADAERRGIKKFVNLGDHVYGPLDPAGTCDLLMRTEMACLLGNQDRMLLEPPLDNPTFRSVTDQLEPKHLEWLAGLPPVASLESLFLCHGSPTSDTEYLTEDVSCGFPALRPEKETAADIAEVAQKVVLCGHTHVPRCVTCAGKLIVNPGSVGLPAYEDDAPVPHRMETGSPHARYALLEIKDSNMRCALVNVEYDHERAARTAEKNGRDDWAKWLRTGRCAG